jgi:hypothetical protein
MNPLQFSCVPTTHATLDKFHLQHIPLPLMLHCLWSSTSICPYLLNCIWLTASAWLHLDPVPEPVGQPYCPKEIFST